MNATRRRAGAARPTRALRTLPPALAVPPPGIDPIADRARLAGRGDLLAAHCPSREVLKHLTSRWGVQVLMVLGEGTHRFSALRRRIGGVSERMLAQTLQWLEADGLVDRVARDVVPPHVEYSLSPLGAEAAVRVRALADWVEARLPWIAAAHHARATDSEPVAAPATTRFGGPATG